MLTSAVVTEHLDSIDEGKHDVCHLLLQLQSGSEYEHRNKKTGDGNSKPDSK